MRYGDVIHEEGRGETVEGFDAKLHEQKGEMMTGRYHQRPATSALQLLWFWWDFSIGFAFESQNSIKKSFVLTPSIWHWFIVNSVVRHT